MLQNIMGLDMYLHAKHHIGNKWREPEKQVRVIVPENQEGETFKIENIKQERISEISEEIGYWRKANHIHAWFVENVQDGEDDCKEYYVSHDNIQKLLDTVNEVLNASELVEGKVTNGYTYENGKRVPIIEEGKTIKDATKAKELLPVQEGFFFGGTEYDEYYYQDLLDTKKICEDALTSTASLYYQSSW